MNPTLACAGRSASLKLQSFFWLHPHWWTIALSGGAWTVMLYHAWRHSGHGVAHLLTFPEEIGYWILMVAAMMLPLVTDSVRFTAYASLWSRRHRAIAGFVLGYLAPWVALGIVAATLRQVSWTHTYAAPALGFAAAALWRRTVTYKRALTACQRTWPIAPLGWRAHRDCLCFGGFIGLACVRTCWPLMLACGFAGHGLPAMTGGMAIGLVDQWRTRRRRWSPAFGATLLLASYYTVLTVWELAS